MIYLGRHLSVSKGIENAIHTSIDNDLYTTQIFVGSPQSAQLSKISDEDKATIKGIIEVTDFHLHIHGKYVYNFAKEFDVEAWHLKTVLKELQLAEDIGALNLVIHMGKSVKLQKDVAIDNFIKSIKYICRFLKTNHLDIKLSLELSSNAGTELFSKIEDFAEMFNSFTNDEKKHLSICIDTCHAFVANHDLVNETDTFLDYITTHIGIQYIGLIHLNDSAAELGSKKDRHANIGNGFIGKETLIKIAQFAADNNIDIILETPSKDIEISMNECKNLLEALH
jgi:deoxyribonuclease-4